MEEFTGGLMRCKGPQVWARDTIFFRPTVISVSDFKIYVTTSPIANCFVVKKIGCL